MKKRNDYIGWDECFMLIADVASKRSKDPSTQVGACIVNQQNIPIGIGYNGLPNGCSDDDFPWDREAEDELNTKYPYVVHAEQNAILNSSTSVRGCRIYVSLFPCNECAKLIVQSGIKEIIYLSDKYIDTMPNKAAKRILNSAGVEYRMIEKPKTKIKLLNKQPNVITKVKTVVEDVISDTKITLYLKEINDFIHNDEVNPKSILYSNGSDNITINKFEGCLMFSAKYKGKKSTSSMIKIGDGDGLNKIKADLTIFFDKNGCELLIDERFI